MSDPILTADNLIADLMKARDKRSPGDPVRAELDRHIQVACGMQSIVDQLAVMKTDSEMEDEDGMSGDDAASELSCFIKAARFYSDIRPPAEATTERS